MGQNITVTGMVLHVMPIGEYDKRVVLLTKERGKITAFARGARRPNSQLLAATDPFSFGEFELFEGRSSYTVARASISNYFRELAADPQTTYYGFYFLEFASYYCQENNDEREMLKLLYQSLRALLHPALDKRLVRAVFELKALAVNGEGPNVFSCIACGRRDCGSAAECGSEGDGSAAECGSEGAGRAEQAVRFSVKKGGTLCADCAGKAEDAVLLNPSTVYTMQYVSSARIEKLYTFAVSGQVLSELTALMKDYLRLYTGHPFKSLKILEEMEAFF